MTRRVLATASALVLTAALGACGGQASPSLTAAPVVSAAASGVASTCSAANVTASLKPLGALPAPGKVTSSNPKLAAILKQGYLTAGVAQDTLLFGYRNSMTDTIEGFDIDMLKQVAVELFGADDPSRLHLRVISYDNRVPDVANGVVDIVADTMTINCMREQSIDFSTVYYDAGQRVLVAKGSTATSISALGGKRVCAAKGSTSADTLAALKPAVVVVTVPTQADCLVAFQEGAADAVSTDDTILLGLTAQDPYAQVVGPRFTDEPYGMAVSKDDPDLTRLVNGVLEKDRTDGTWATIYSRWLGKYMSTPAPPAAQYRSGP